MDLGEATLGKHSKDVGRRPHFEDLLFTDTRGNNLLVMEPHFSRITTKNWRYTKTSKKMEPEMAKFVGTQKKQRRYGRNWKKWKTKR